MDRWFTQEYGLYPPKNVPHFTPIKGVKIGHFTQVIWAKTRFVGCGYVYYNVDMKADFPHMKQYTCNYAPTGNYVGEPIYKQGPTCSACPGSTLCNQTTGLCDGSSGGPLDNRPPTRPTPTPPRRPPETYRPAPRYPPPTPPRRHPWPQPPAQYCTPCPCVRSTPYSYPRPASRYPGYRYPPAYTTQRRYPPYAQDPVPRRYPLSYNPRLGHGLPRCEDVKGYKPGEPGQPACVEDGGSGALPSVDDSDGAHEGCLGRDAAIWQYFVAGSATGLAVVVLLGVFVVFLRFIGSTGGAGAKLSTEVTVTPAYSGTST
ncbi:adhesive plaque matrix protein-like [Dermacentor silvarum]|uniref:adhesive plaque matrix protein-like n=1 Tax=Dermacentor silvarum TaxID=543639 RepID=UPI002100D61A|nr:adhesive plaque matrix protein-like [Dermacentor silvarum]